MTDDPKSQFLDNDQRLLTFYIREAKVGKPMLPIFSIDYFVPDRYMEATSLGLIRTNLIYCGRVLS
jgi:hypothetical protein